MKIVDAYWEKRNLGVITYELTVESPDDQNRIKEFEKTSDYEYLVIKIPAQLLPALLSLQDEGYQFIEMNTVCSYDCNKPYSLIGIQKRLYDSISYEKMSNDDIEYLFMRITEGMFVTDRVYIDAFFRKRQSAKRYIGWIQDEISRGANLYSILYKDKKVGFFGLSQVKDNECFAFLGGVFPEYQRIGIGVIMNCFEIDEAKRQGAKRVITSFSSNNRGAYAVHLALNYTLIDNYYVFIKHRGR